LKITQTYHQKLLKPFSYKYKTNQKSCVHDMYVYVCTGMVYEEKNNLKTLDFIASPEGRAIPKIKVNPLDISTTGDQMKFEYSLKDHLGNLRVSCRCGEPKRDAAGTIIPDGQPGAGIELVAVVQEQYYDAWGLAFEALAPPSGWSDNSAGGSDRFTYNSKELLTDLDLGWNDYVFRMYDASIGRWSTVDLLIEENYFSSGYTYVLNNPLNLMDPFGLDTTKANSTSSDPVKKGDVILFDNKPPQTMDFDEVVIRPKPEEDKMTILSRQVINHVNSDKFFTHNPDDLRDYHPPRLDGIGLNLTLDGQWLGMKFGIATGIYGDANNAMLYRGTYNDLQVNFPISYISFIPSLSGSISIYGSKYGKNGNLTSLLGTSRQYGASTGIIGFNYSQSTNSKFSSPNNKVSTFGIGIGTPSPSKFGVSSGYSNTDYFTKIY
jgi:RHS repeat-associated protein